MKKRKLKLFVMPVIYGLMFSTLVLSILVLYKTGNDNKQYVGKDNYTYVNKNIFPNTVKTIKEEEVETIKNPFNSEKVEVYKKYYDVNSGTDDMKKSIIFYNNTYMQNTGIIYKSNEVFDVTPILSGTVIDIKEDETLGCIVEIKHTNNMVSSYHGLINLKVKKDQVVNQNDIIGQSGTLKIDNVLDNSLLFELIYDGKLVNPDDYYNKKINEL